MTITMSCNGQKTSNNNKTGAIMKQKIPENALCLLSENEYGLTYLTFIQLLPEYRQRNEIFIGNGDYFLSYTIIRISKNGGSESGRTLHVIPESNNRFRLEIRGDNDSFYFYKDGERIDGHAEPIGKWNFAGYSDDENIEAAKVLKYFNEHNEK